MFNELFFVGKGNNLSNYNIYSESELLEDMKDNKKYFWSDGSYIYRFKLLDKFDNKEDVAKYFKLRIK